MSLKKMSPKKCPQKIITKKIPHKKFPKNPFQKISLAPSRLFTSSKIQSHVTSCSTTINQMAKAIVELFAYANRIQRQGVLY